MLDILILIVLGGLFGRLLTYAKLRSIYVAIIVAVLGAVAGYFVVETLPQNLQSLQYLLQLDSGSQLNLIYQSGGLSGLVMFANYFMYYSFLVGVSYSLLGYGIMLLLSKVGKKSTRARKR
jgi:hypothetical protein